MYQYLYASGKEFATSSDIGWKVNISIDMKLKDIEANQGKFCLFKKKTDFDTPAQLIADYRNYIKTIKEKIKKYSVIKDRNKLNVILNHYTSLEKQLDKQEKRLAKLKSNK